MYGIYELESIQFTDEASTIHCCIVSSAVNSTCVSETLRLEKILIALGLEQSNVHQYIQFSAELERTSQTRASYTTARLVEKNDDPNPDERSTNSIAVYLTAGMGHVGDWLVA